MDCPFRERGWRRGGRDTRGKRGPEHQKKAGEKECFLPESSSQEEKTRQEEDINGRDDENSRSLVKEVTRNPSQKIEKTRDDKTRERSASLRAGPQIDRLRRELPE